MYSLLVPCHYVNCCLLQPVHCLLVPHTVQSVGSVSPCPLISFRVCPLSFSTSQCTVCWFCVTMPTAVLYSLSTVCQYLTMYSLLVLCHYVHCCLLVCPLSVSTSQCTAFWFCVTMSTVVFYNLSTVCQYLTMYSLLFLCQYVQCCLLQSVQCLSVPHNVQSVVSVSLCPLLSSTACPLSVSTSHCTVCWFCVTMSTDIF